MEISVRSKYLVQGSTNFSQATKPCVIQKFGGFSTAVNPSRFELSLDRLRVAEIQLGAPSKSSWAKYSSTPLKYRLTILLLSIPPAIPLISVLEFLFSRSLYDVFIANGYPVLNPLTSVKEIKHAGT